MKTALSTKYRIWAIFKYLISLGRKEIWHIFKNTHLLLMAPRLLSLYLLCMYRDTHTVRASRCTSYWNTTNLMIWAGLPRVSDMCLTPWSEEKVTGIHSNNMNPWVHFSFRYCGTFDMVWLVTIFSYLPNTARRQDRAKVNRRHVRILNLCRI